MHKDILLIDSCEGTGVYLDLKESNVEKGLLRFRGKFQEAEAVNKNKRMYPFGVLDENVQRIMDVVKARGLIGELDHPCICDSDFRVLTPNGWKQFTEIRPGDSVYARKDGQMVESKVQGIVNEPYDGPVYRVKGRGMDCTFTPNHKFLLLDRNGNEVYATVRDIVREREKFNHHCIPKTATLHAENHRTFTIPGVTGTRQDYTAPLQMRSDVFAAFMGIYLAEGHVQTGTHRVQISQTTEYGKNLIVSLLQQTGLQWKECRNGFYVNDARLYAYLAPLGNKYTKYVPAEVKAMSADCLENLLLWFAIGDGRILQVDSVSLKASNLKKQMRVAARLDNGKFSRISVFSVSKQLVRDLHECLVKAGYNGSLSTVTDTKDYQYAGRTIKASSKKPLHVLSLLRGKNVHLDSRFLSIADGHHTGRIYCLTTEHGNFYMEYKGKSFWTGNSDSIIHFKEASHVITKLWWDGNVLMGEGEILSTAHGRQLKALINDGVRIGVSSRGVGNGKVNENGILVIGESYRLITFDCVADPSCHEAFQERVVATKHEHAQPEKIRTGGIHNVNKQAVIAAVSGIVKSRADALRNQI